MTINIQYVKMPFSEAMTQYVIDKLGKLGERYQWITRPGCFSKKKMTLREMERSAKLN